MESNAKIEKIKPPQKLSEAVFGYNQNDNLVRTFPNKMRSNLFRQGNWIGCVDVFCETS